MAAQFAIKPSLLLVIVFSAASLYSQFFPHTLADFKLHGKVKSTVETYHFIPKGNSEIIRAVEEYYFNIDGNLTEMKRLNDDGSLREKNTYQYNRSGKLIFTERRDAENKLLLSNHLEYNDNGILIKDYCVNNYMAEGRRNWWVTYNYNEQGNCIEMISRNDAGEYSTHYDFKYDSLGRKIEMIWTQDGETRQVCGYLYDSNERLIEEWQKNDGGNSSSHAVYTYNDQGIVIEEGSRQSDGIYRRFCTLELDENGNWTKKVFYPGFDRTRFDRRVIEYY